jgi:hypothetical protein
VIAPRTAGWVADTTSRQKAGFVSKAPANENDPWFREPHILTDLVRSSTFNQPTVSGALMLAVAIAPN